MKIAKNVNNLGTELVYDIFSKTKNTEIFSKFSQIWYQTVFKFIETGSNLSYSSY